MTEIESGNILKSLSFLGVVVLLTMGALAWTHTSWSKRILTNESASRHKAILEGVGVSTRGMDSNAIEYMFTKHFRSGSGGILRYTGPGGPLSCYPIRARGLWGPIEGWLIMEPDGHTIHSVVITHQEETPGLGAEVASPSFLARFRGRSIVYAGGRRLAVVKAGQARAEYEIDGISGATLTTRGFGQGLDSAMSMALKYGGSR